MQNILYLIISIIALMATIAFFSWGIYQIKTGQMVARLARNPIDEPREVGMLFLAVSALCLWLTWLTACIFFAPVPGPILGSLTEVLGTTIILLVALSAIIAAVLGIKNHRIFGLKNLPKIRNLIKKYSYLTNISLIILAVALPTLVIFIDSLSPLAIILFIISVICIFTTVIPLIIISLANKN